jgi:hypothetical protein
MNLIKLIYHFRKKFAFLFGIILVIYKYFIKKCIFFSLFWYFFCIFYYDNSALLSINRHIHDFIFENCSSNILSKWGLLSDSFVYYIVDENDHGYVFSIFPKNVTNFHNYLGNCSLMDSFYYYKDPVLQHLYEDDVRFLMSIVGCNPLVHDTGSQLVSQGLILERLTYLNYVCSIYNDYLLEHSLLPGLDKNHVPSDLLDRFENSSFALTKLRKRINLFRNLSIIYIFFKS